MTTVPAHILYQLDTGDQEQPPATLFEILATNDLNDEILHAVLSLQPGESYCDGGGAAPEWSIRRLHDPQPEPLGFDEIMSAARSWHQRGVDEIADRMIRDLMRDHPELTASERRDWLTGEVDEVIEHHSRVIYNAQASMLLAASKNDEAWAEDRDPDAQPPDVAGRAYCAFRADIWEELERRSDEWEVEPATDEPDPCPDPDADCSGAVRP